MHRLISFVLNFFLNYAVYQRIVSKMDIVRSFWLKPYFKELGKRSRIGKIGRLTGLKFIRIGSNTVLQEFFYLTAWKNKEYMAEGKMPELTIGDNCNLGAFGHISCSNKIIIGNNCLIGKCVTITDNYHGNTDFASLQCSPARRPIYSKGPVVIEENVWIGDKVVVLPNVHIGRNAIVGANSVVTHDVPAFAVVAGNPAQIIKLLK